MTYLQCRSITYLLVNMFKLVIPALCALLSLQTPSFASHREVEIPANQLKVDYNDIQNDPPIGPYPETHIKLTYHNKVMPATIRYCHNSRDFSLDAQAGGHMLLVITVIDDPGNRFFKNICNRLQIEDHSD